MTCGELAALLLAYDADAEVEPRARLGGREVRAALVEVEAWGSPEDERPTASLTVTDGVPPEIPF